MTDYDWPVIRDQCVRWFGDTPSKPTELEILTVFKDRPRAVIRALQDVAGLVTAGECTSGWGLARHRVARLKAVQAVATDDQERERQLDRALGWVRTAGVHYDRETEVLEELFGARGWLRDWPELQAVVLDEWRRVAPA